MVTRPTKPRATSKKAGTSKAKATKKRSRKAKDASTLIVAIYSTDRELLAREVARHEKMGSRASLSTIVRYLIRAGLKEGSALPPMPAQYAIPLLVTLAAGAHLI